MSLLGRSRAAPSPVVERGSDGTGMRHAGETGTAAAPADSGASLASVTVELAYAEYGGTRTGIPVVLLHAFPVTSAMYDAVATQLAEQHHVITPDFRGFGGSVLGDGEPSLDVMADDVAALLGRLDLDRVVLAGLSMGGYVAMAMLRRHPQRIGAVVLMDTKAAADAPQARENRERMARAVLDEGPSALRPMLESLLGGTTRRDRPQVVEMVARWIEAVDPRGVAWAQRAMAARPSSFRTLADAGLPGFVVVGEEDTLTTHDDALAMAAAFAPQAPVHVIPRAGHLSAVENPDAVAGALRDVLRHV
jgi:pimeloyl-ACP methyl ester carboxylesterase